MNDGSWGFFVFQILNIEQYTGSRKKGIFHISFFSLKMLQRIQTLFLLFSRSLIIDKLLVMHSMLGPAISHASAEFRNKELVHKMWNQRSGLRGIMVHYCCEIRVFHWKIYIVTGKGVPCFLILSLFIVAIAHFLWCWITWQRELQRVLCSLHWSSCYLPWQRIFFLITISCVQEL